VAGRHGDDSTGRRKGLPEPDVAVHPASLHSTPDVHGGQGVTRSRARERVCRGYISDEPWHSSQRRRLELDNNRRRRAGTGVVYFAGLAGVTQLVEYLLPKQAVAGSSPVPRSAICDAMAPM
jgi:hypothetical protein